MTTFKKTLALFSLGLLTSLSFGLKAQPENTTDKEIIIAPSCLLKNLDANYTILSSVNEYVLLATNSTGLEKLIEAKTQRREKPCGGFRNVTRAWEEDKIKNKFAPDAFLIQEISAPKLAPFSKYSIKYETQVNALMDKLQPKNMWDTIKTLSAFPDRYGNSNNGVKAAELIKSQIESMAKDSGHSDVTVYFVPTGRYKQPSVVAKLGAGTDPGIVIGGHMDTLNSSYELKPGADDDGSGTATVLETARVILDSKIQFKKPIYFIWYAAEEVGLVGSDYVVQDFKKKKIPVEAVIQFDMTGYSKNNDLTMWLIKDYVNKELTGFLETLIQTYVKQPVKYTACGYACSDHASWHKGGFTASFPVEAAFGSENPHIHTAKDTLEKLSLPHMANFAKLATAFVVELAEPLS